MADWIVCPSCNLRHTRRTNGECPRCKLAVDHAQAAPKTAPPVSPGAEPRPEPSAEPAAEPAHIPIELSSGSLGLCEACLRAAPTKQIELYQNIGALVMRFHKTLKGNLCRQCIDKYFWEYTLYTLFLGWWGVISFIVTPIFLVNNVVRYLGSRSLETA
jgi:hypothetical protein